MLLVSMYNIDIKPRSFADESRLNLSRTKGHDITFFAYFILYIFS